ncbi:putative transcription factor C2H2 family [Helianthus annuus]|uniref:Putative zinc finger, RING/FYVE/PHD-type n=1 Tax=Helianthus annuus TaxID=4232 RepID=A0A251SYX1_HELAN|nr:RING-H2 finger protein ATL70 [Helianthus annuus]KAF5770520.1 putative transcription factor C2H2 family [Helianthus annuus]KAJ0487007.1 putative transcription factor C2H2 family [Helianthus annuus]
MNTTINAGEPPYTTTDPGNTEVTIPYGLGFFLVVIFLVVTLCYGSYIYKSSTRFRPPPRANTTIAFGTTTNHHHAHDDHHLITFSQGLADDVLVTFPTFVYSEALMPRIHKGDASTDDTNNSGCSICLADYNPADVLRLLPECGHLFHVSCVDTWLKVHPTCPVCRNSPIPMV